MYCDLSRISFLDDPELRLRVPLSLPTPSPQQHRLDARSPRTLQPRAQPLARTHKRLQGQPSTISPRVHPSAMDVETGGIAPTKGAVMTAGVRVTFAVRVQHPRKGRVKLRRARVNAACLLVAADALSSVLRH